MTATRAEILAAVRARLSVAWPAAADVSEEPQAVAPARLPAFGVRAEQAESEPRAMGTPGAYIVRDVVTVTGWTSGGPDLEARLHRMGEGLETALLAPPAYLAGRAFEVDREGVEVEVVAGESRVGRVEVRLAIRYATPPLAAAPDVDPFDAGFSPAFD